MLDILLAVSYHNLGVGWCLLRSLREDRETVPPSAYLGQII